MAKKSQRTTSASHGTTQTATPSQRNKDADKKGVSRGPAFPVLTSRDDVTCTTLLEDQILLFEVCTANS